MDIRNIVVTSRMTLYRESGLNSGIQVGMMLQSSLVLEQALIDRLTFGRQHGTKVICTLVARGGDATYMIAEIRAGNQSETVLDEICNRFTTVIADDGTLDLEKVMAMEPLFVNPVTTR